MALVILNDDIGFSLAQKVLDGLRSAIAIEMAKIEAGNGDPRKIADLCNEFSNIARQLDEQAKKRFKPEFVKVNF